MPAIVDQEDKVFRRLFTGSTELKRLANKAADLQYPPCVRNHLLAISACQNHSYIGPGFRGFSNNLKARSFRDGHVQQHHINLTPVLTNKLDCRRPIGSFEYLK